MSAIVPTSPAGSAKGWSFKVWFARNKGYVKGTVAALAGAGNYAIGLIKDPVINGAVSTVFGLAVRLALDWLDFYLSEVPIP